MTQEKKFWGDLHALRKHVVLRAIEDGAVTPDEIDQEFRTRGVPVTPAEVRPVLWELIDSGDLRLTGDWKLEIP